MVVFKREILSQKMSVLIWGLVLGFLIATSVLIYPEMKSQMDQMSEMMASMGSFTKAFGMDQLNFGALADYYAIECGNIIGIGGAFFAAIVGMAALMKEEHERTAEFLLTHPVSRARVITEKLLSVFAVIVIMNAVVLACSALALLIIGEEIAWGSVMLFHAAFLILQFQIASICFGISAFVHKGSIGTGIGIAAVLYFMNIISNITEDARVLKYITPFGYTDCSYIANNHGLEVKYLVPGLCFMAAGIVAGYIKYLHKDIRA